MSREILFRAWDKVKKQMFYQGSANEENRCVFWKRWENTAGSAQPMQFTGLVDKKGVNIFEGDIVRILYTDWTSQSDYSISLEEYLKSLADKNTGLIEMRGAEWCAYNQKLGYFILKGIAPHGFIEVIGNVHQNPELL